MKENVSYCGIDVGLRNHAVCLMSSSQEVVSRFFIRNNLDGFTKLKKFLSKKTKICLEPTGVYSVNIFVYFKKEGYDIRFCNTRSSKRFREAMYGKKKHDKLDSVSLAKYRIVNESLTFDRLRFLEKQELKSNTRFTHLEQLSDDYRRKGLMLAKTKNKIKRVIDLRFPESIDIFTKDRASKSILNILQHSKRDVLEGKIKVKKLKEIQTALKNSIGQYDLMQEEFKELVSLQDELEVEIEKLKVLMHSELELLGYSELLKLMGFNEISLSLILSEIKDINRFFIYNSDGSLNKKRSLKVFKEYIGLTTTSNQSGEREGGHKNISGGNKNLRHSLFLLTICYISLEKPVNVENHCNFDPYRYKPLYEEYIKRKPRMIGVMKVMSKVVTDLFFLFKNLESVKY